MPKKKKKGPKKDKDETLTRIAIVNSDKCKPKKCRQECKKGCPVVRMGKLCIEVGATSKLAWISEELCIGCGICKKKCPFGAINIINLPKDLEGQTTHRFGQNSFKLHRLPMPRPGQVLGLVGTNGIGKSTALKILAGKLKPNLGQFDRQADWEEILTYFRGSELHNYFTKLLEDDIKAIIKPQYVDQIPHAVKGSVRRILTAKNDPDRDKMDEILEELDLGPVIDRTVDKLSGGELQRFAIGVVSVQNADVYMLDEPSSYLDVKQRLKAARVIRRLAGEQKYVICVEHDLSVLDYLSDYICVLYGVPGAYGVVTMPFSVRDGINIFLAGFIRTENLRFRDEELDFKLSESAETQDADAKRLMEFEYPDMVKTLTSKGNKFVLEVEEGGFTDSEIIVLLGENGTGKTTFIRMLAGLIQPDAEPEPSSEEEFDLSSDEEEGQHYGKKADGSIDYSNYIGEKKKEKEVKGPKKKLPVLSVSYKPQKISPKFQGTVRMLMHKRIRDAYVHPQFVTDVIKPLKVDRLMDQEVRHHLEESCSVVRSA